MKMKSLLTSLLTSALLSSAAFAADLKIGLQEDPDVLDPDQSRTFVGRIIYASLCDKLVDINPQLEIIPRLATDWTWSEDGLELTMNLRQDATFHDGTPFNAQAVIDNIDRSQNLPESRRKSQVKSITKVEAMGDHTVKFTLANPDATLLSQFADRAGMMLSPTAAKAAGVDFGNKPICSGPYKFVERVQQDRMVLEKFSEHWDADKYAFDKVTFLPIPDTTVRLANLRSGDLDMLERLAPSDAAAVKADDALQYEEIVGLGYQGVTFNVANGDQSANPAAQNAKIRKAFSLAIDRQAISKVVFEGIYAPGNQPYPPTSPWYNQDDPVPARDVEAAKALLKEAGQENLTLEVQVTNNPVQTQLMQVVQSMVADAGIQVKLKSMEFASLLADQSAGKYQASQIGWSGRIDPDGNIHQFMTCKGGINDSKYCNPEIDKLLDAARTSNDVAARKEKYVAAQKILSSDLPIVYLYHQAWIFALNKNIGGFTPYPDGMIRLEGMTKK